MNQSEIKLNVPLYEKYGLTVTEATEYFGIGDKKLRQIAADNPTADFLLHIGVKTLFKRVLFEKYLDETSSI